MIIEFKASNFRSIRSEAQISFVASADDTHPNNYSQKENYNILKTASIYGANGSGKTTVIAAIAFMQAMVVNSINNQIGDLINVPSHKLSINEPSSFEIQFINNNVRYAYGFTFNKQEIIEEYLYFFPVGGRQNKIFERENANIVIGQSFLRPLSVAKSILKQNQLFLSCCAKYGDIKFEQMQLIIDAFMFFKDKLIIYNPQAPSPWFGYSVMTLQKNNDIKNIFRDTMNGLGSDIIDLSAKFSRKKISLENLPKNIPTGIVELITGIGETNVPEVVLNYEQFDIMLQEESNGIQKLFDILCPILDIIESGKVLIYDEIETSLHESIVKEIVNFFIKSNNAQLIFTTHNTNLLDLSVLRRDQIWFTELEKTYRSTQLYSLSDINNVRKDENIAKGYIIGKYGAIPVLNQSLLDEITRRN